MFRHDFLCLNNISGFKYRIALLRLFQNIGKFIMGGQHDCIHITVSCTLPIGQSQTTSHHLLTQNFRSSSAERSNGVEIIYIPAFFQHVDVNYDFYWIFRVFYIKQQTSICIAFGAFLLRMDNDGFIAICAASEFIGTDIFLHPCSVSGIFANNKHKRLHHTQRLVRGAVIHCVHFQFSLSILVTGNAVQQHHFIKLLITEIIKINIRASHSKGRTSIAVLDSLGQRILVYDIFERYLLRAFGDKRCGSQLQPE